MVKKIIGAILLMSAFFIRHAAAQNADGQRIEDDKILTEFFHDNKIKATRTNSGLYYVVKKQGTGEHARKGQTVTMKYKGMFLDGRKFDANVDDNFNQTHPFSFQLGVGRVIPGWDEGVQLLSPGTRAMFYIPSGLAYGPRGGGPIPPNSVLVFEVELVSAQ